LNHSNSSVPFAKGHERDGQMLEHLLNDLGVKSNLRSLGGVIATFAMLNTESRIMVPLFAASPKSSGILGNASPPPLLLAATLALTRVISRISCPPWRNDLYQIHTVMVGEVSAGLTMTKNCMLDNIFEISHVHYIRRVQRRHYLLCLDLLP